MGKANIDAVFAKYVNQVPVKLDESAGLAVSLLLPYGINPHVVRQL
jgi:hypothetical protein